MYISWLLGPELFIPFTSDQPRPVSANRDVYPDDTAVVTFSSDVFVCHKLQRSVDELTFRHHFSEIGVRFLQAWCALVSCSCAGQVHLYFSSIRLFSNQFSPMVPWFSPVPKRPDALRLTGLWEIRKFIGTWTSLS